MNYIKALPIIFASTVLFAKPTYMNLLAARYPENSKLRNACDTCHRNGRGMGPFGKDFFRLKSELGFDHMDQVFTDLAKLDSDGDGKSNEEELKAGLNPNKADN